MILFLYFTLGIISKKIESNINSNKKGFINLLVLLINLIIEIMKEIIIQYTVPSVAGADC